MFLRTREMRTRTHLDLLGPSQKVGISILKSVSSKHLGNGCSKSHERSPSANYSFFRLRFARSVVPQPHETVEKATGNRWNFLGAGLGGRVVLFFGVAPVRLAASADISRAT